MTGLIIPGAELPRRDDDTLTIPPGRHQKSESPLPQRARTQAALQYVADLIAKHDITVPGFIFGPWSDVGEDLRMSYTPRTDTELSEDTEQMRRWCRALGTDPIQTPTQIRITHPYRGGHIIIGLDLPQGKEQ